jgi:transcriptional regulator with XRE-family HTH domain
MAPKETPLRRWLHARGISIEKFARMIDLSFNTIGLVSRGARPPSDNVKVKIYWTTLNYERDNGEKKPKGIEPAAWFDLSAPPAPPEPVPMPGKRRAAPVATAKKGTRKGR